MLTSIVAASYFFAAFAFAFLALLMLTSWRKRRRGAALTCACATTAAWAAVTGFAALRGMSMMPLAAIAEILRGAM